MVPIRHTFLFLLSITLCWTAPASAWGVSKERRAQADSLYAVAIREAAGLPLKERIRRFKQVLKLSYRHAPAHHALARCYIEQGTVASRMSAEVELQEALQRDWDNVEYNLTYADLLWRKGMPGEARRRYERILMRAPDRQSVAEAASGAARYFLLGMLRYLNMYINTRPVLADDASADLPASLLQDDVHVMALRSFGEKDRDRALDYLNRALAADPDHRPSVARLCLLHYEEGRPDSVVIVAGQYLERHPDDEDALLYQGLGYQALGELALAAESYEKALKHMSAEARGVMESVEDIASADEQKALARQAQTASAAVWTDTPGLTDFWGRRDPLLLTPFNERRMEHYGRVAYANLRFSRPEEGVPGWKTEQGQVYIRYGRYLGRTVLRPNEVGQIYHETWSYEGFNVTFQNWDGLDHWRFESYRDPAQRSPVSDKKELYARHPGRYLDPYEDQKYDLPHQVAAFREADGRVRLEASYALPVDELRYRRVGNRYGVDTQRGAFLLDSVLVEVSRDVVRDATPRRVNEDHRGRVYTVDETRWTVPPGRYTAVGEVKDHRSGRIGQFRREVDVRRFAHPGLCLSDILLARDIRRIGQEESSRAAFAVDAHPLRIYRVTDDVAVYFEVYGLTPGADGRTAYEVSYTLSRPHPQEVDLRLFPAPGGTPVPKSTPPVHAVVYRPGIDTWGGTTDLFRPPASDGQVVEYRVEYQAEAREEGQRIDHPMRLTPERARELGLTRKAFSTTITLRYEGGRTEEPRTLRVDVRQAQMGLQKLSLMVRDLQTNAQVSGWTLVRVVE